MRTLLETLAMEQYERIVKFTEEGIPSIESERFSRYAPCFTKAGDYTTIKVSLRWGKSTR